MSDDALYPHGKCECIDGCRCSISPGPAAMQVKRDGKALKVCTRCILTDDSDRSPLVTKDTPLSPYMRYDSFGVVTLALGLEDEEPESNPETVH